MKKKLMALIASFLAIQLAFVSFTTIPSAFAEGPVGSGSMNVDIDISADKSSIESGQTGIYNLIFKVTGSTTEFNNAQIVVDLPQSGPFAQPLEELTIAGVQPVYSSSENTLTYNFPVLTTGQVYTTKIKVVPPNGITPDGTELEAKASFSATGIATATDSAVIKVTASVSQPTVTKGYTSTVGKPSDKPPVQGDEGVWTIAVSFPKRTTGQLYLQPGSLITVTDAVPTGTMFASVESPGSYDPASNLVTWTFVAPSIAEQDLASGSLFTQTMHVNLSFNGSLPPFYTITNEAKVTATAVHGQPLSGNASAKIQIASSSGAYPVPTGDWLVPQHQIDGGTDTPTVYDWEALWFTTQYSIQQGYSTGWNETKVLQTGYQQVTQKYLIDENLDLSYLLTFLPYYKPASTIAARPLDPLPQTTIQAKVNGVLLNPHIVDFSSVSQVPADGANVVVPLSALGISPGEHVEEILITYSGTNENPVISGGLAANSALYMFFNIKPGTLGFVTNHVEESGVFGDGTSFTVTSGDVLTPRSADVVEQPDVPAVVKNAISFTNVDGNAISTGNNTLSGAFSNDGSSLRRMNEPFGDMVLLPVGVTVAANPEATFKNNSGPFAPGNGALEIVDNDYKGTGRQLVRITWTATTMRPGQNLGFRFNVVVSANTPSPLLVDSYGYSGDATMTAAGQSGTDITANSDNITGSGNLTQPLAHTTNQYVLTQSAGLVTKKSVKGDLDNSFSSFGHVSPGGTITYNLDIKNVYTDIINNMTLFDVLPSAGDLGITDNVARGSLWTPTLTGPITLPAEWQGKVKVSYSTATNPERGDLDANTDYPDTTTHLVDPPGAQAPNWMDASSVGSSWSDIHSFKLELAPGVQFIRGASMNLQFTMTAPANLDPSLTDPEIPEVTRAAWNSFAYATNKSQAVEPARVGVAVNRGLPEEPVVTKTVDGQSSIKLANRNDTFHYTVAFDFGTAATSWDAVSLIDDLANQPAVQGIPVQDVLQFVPSSVTIKDENGNDVTPNGSLSASESRIEFAIDKQNANYGFLEGHTYTLEVDAKIRSSATDAQLQAFASNSGIPNTADLSIQSAGTTKTVPSNTVVVVPPAPNPNSNTGKLPLMGDSLILFTGAAALFIAAGTLRFFSLSRKKKNR